MSLTAICDTYFGQAVKSKATSADGYISNGSKCRCVFNYV